MPLAIPYIKFIQPLAIQGGRARRPGHGARAWPIGPWLQQTAISRLSMCAIPQSSEYGHFLPARRTRGRTSSDHGDLLLLAATGPSIWTMQVNEKAYLSGSSARRALKNQENTYTTGLRCITFRSPRLARNCFNADRRHGPAPSLVREALTARYVLSLEFTYILEFLVTICCGHFRYCRPAKAHVVCKYWLPACGPGRSKRDLAQGQALRSPSHGWSPALDLKQSSRRVRGLAGDRRWRPDQAPSWCFTPQLGPAVRRRQNHPLSSPLSAPGPQSCWVFAR